MEASERETERLCYASSDLRSELLTIPVRSPQSLLIKLALTVEAETLTDVETACREAHWSAEELVLPLLADLEAMAQPAT